MIAYLEEIEQERVAKRACDLRRLVAAGEEYAMLLSSAKQREDDRIAAIVALAAATRAG